MSLFKKKATGPQHQERLAQAQADTEYAGSLFERAAAQSDRAADAAQTVASELELDIQKLIALQNEADEQAVTARKQAAAIRGVLG